ncbi:MAG: serine/threonine protein kinase [Desulfurococcales archaeon ex4484_58]|nr:MAG: serine/threonine protein kinase [Desulfurococcales archaeon ex4484_58]
MVIRGNFEASLLDARMHRLDESSDFIRYILCFPKKNCNELYDRLGNLVDDGFTHLIEYGKIYDEYHIIGKGYSSIVVLAYNKYYGSGLLKIRRIDSRRKTLEYEGIVLDYLDKTGYTPKLYLWRKDYIFREYLGPQCMEFNELLDHIVLEEKDRARLTLVLKKVSSALYFLDLLGIDHGELNRPYKHIYWCKSNVKIIDWESSSFVRKPHNLTSVFSFLMYRYKYREKLWNIIGVDIEEIKDILKEYKVKRSITVLKKIFMLLEQPLPY